MKISKNTRIAFTLIIWAIALFVTERISGNTISDILAKLICGETYLQEENGILSELSCGFDADMYLVAFLALLFIIGIVLFIVGSTKDH